MINSDFNKECTALGEKLGRLLSNNGAKISIFLGNVESVDDDNVTMDVRIGNGLVVSGISRAIAIGGDTSILVTPKIGSIVALASPYGRQTDAFPVKFSEIDKISLRNDVSDNGTDLIEIDKEHIKVDRDKYSFEISNGSISLSCDGGENFRIDGSDILSQRLDKLANEVNDLISKYNEHTHIVNTEGSATAQTGTAEATTSTANNVSNFN